MGEYADEQISRDMQKMFGIGYDGSDKSNKSKKVAQKVKCPKCGKGFKPVGLNDHIRDYHGNKEK